MKTAVRTKRPSPTPPPTPTRKVSDDEKLQKVLANAGCGSRREIEGWISEGRVTVDGEVAHLGQRVKPSVQINLDGRPVAIRSVIKPRVIIYHKPIGEVCTRSDPEGRITVFERLPRMQGGRWIGIGRLDLNTSGLLLLTTDGELANRLMHPSTEIEREYLVRVRGEVSVDILKQLQRGVMLEDGNAHFDSVTAIGGEGSNRHYLVTLKEGRNREVRRLWEAVGCEVSRLKRTRYGNITIPKTLVEGKWHEVSGDDYAGLYQLAGLSVPVGEEEISEQPRPKRVRRAAPQDFAKRPRNNR